MDTQYKIGIGYDIHRLVDNRKLILGGVDIPFSKGLDGHSDADALLHAICDALLGALGEADIGEHFPDTDSRYQGISSMELLKKVYNMVEGQGFGIANVDTVIIAEAPKLASFKPQMKKNIAGVLNLQEQDVNIKAKTQEGIGFGERKEAVAVYASILLNKR